MENNFVEILPTDLNESQVKMWDKDWFLIAAGTPEKHNMMTASWGGMGYLWNKPVAFVFIRPSRHTYKFTEDNDYMTLSIFGEEHREALRFCGKQSGRDFDKSKECGLTPFASPANSVFFEEAKLLIEGRKLFFQDIDPKKFLLPELENHYADKQYHRMYIVEITKVLQKK